MLVVVGSALLVLAVGFVAGFVVGRLASGRHRRGLLFYDRQHHTGAELRRRLYR